MVLGIVIAFGASYVGSTLWKSRAGSGDLLFSELMLWGWLRRLWIERRITSTIALLDGVDDDADLSRRAPRSSCFSNSRTRSSSAIPTRRDIPVGSPGTRR